MAKFNSGQIDGIKFKVSPVGLRRYLYKIIPYVIGYDVKANISIEILDAQKWDLCVLSIDSHIHGKTNHSTQNLNYQGQSKWSQCVNINNPSWPGYHDIGMQISYRKYSNDERIEDIDIIKDLKVVSWWSVLPWIMGSVGTVCLMSTAFFAVLTYLKD